jgi:metal-sulfur cluster biosynthetic enzyme
MLLSAVHESVARLPGVNNVNVELVWEPPWDPSVMATEEAKDVLGIW